MTANSSKIASDLIEMVDTDVNSRKDWVEMYVQRSRCFGDEV
jgi:hypothetical protein